MLAWFRGIIKDPKKRAILSWIGGGAWQLLLFSARGGRKYPFIARLNSSVSAAQAMNGKLWPKRPADNEGRAPRPAIQARLTILSPDNAAWKHDLAWFDGRIKELEKK